MTPTTCRSDSPGSWAVSTPRSPARRPWWRSSSLGSSRLGIAASVARTGLRSDASARWERGVDAYGIDTSIARFVELLARDVPEPRGPRRGDRRPRRVIAPGARAARSLRVSQAERIIGVELTRDDVAALLDPIGFTVTGDDPEALTVALPTWRPDSTAEIDVIEEVARHYGYENVPKRVPLSPLHGHLSVAQQRRRKIREVLLGLGVSEVMPSPFLSDDDLRRSRLDGPVLRITNPLVADEDVLRPSLRPGLLRAVAYNQAHRRPRRGALRDRSPCTRRVPASCPTNGRCSVSCSPVPKPRRRSPCGVSSPSPSALVRESTSRTSRSGSIQRVRRACSPAATPSARWARSTRRFSTSTRSPDASPSSNSISRRCWSGGQTRAVEGDEPTPIERPRPGVRPRRVVPAEKLEKAIRQGAGNLLVRLELFDVYRGAGLPDGSRSLAYRLRLQATDRTLTDADTAAVVAQVRAAADKLGATLRS